MGDGQTKRLLMPLSEYNRIHQVAHGVLRDIGNPEKACVFFATFGAYVLSRHYNIDAQPVAGAFGLCVSDGPDVIFFGNEGEGQLTSSADGFHMWVQTESHIIDFMAPIFPETFAAKRPLQPIPRKMLQRLRSSESDHLSELFEPGRLATFPDPDLTRELLDNFLARPVNGDLMHIATIWFGSRRGKQKPQFAMRDDLGNIVSLSLAPTIATGAW